jgi:hypothetical protein
MMFTGTPIWKTDVLKRVIEGAFQEQCALIKKPLKTIADVYAATGIDLRIVAADLRNPTPIIHRRRQDSFDLVTHLLDSAAIPFYNSAILSRLVAKYEAGGTAKVLALIKKMSPAAWRHIHLNGHYRFRGDGKLIDLDSVMAGIDLAGRNFRRFGRPGSSRSG